jgi:hypothetical protein
MAYWIGRGVLKKTKGGVIIRGEEIKKGDIGEKQYESLKKKGLIEDNAPAKTEEDLDERLAKNKAKAEAEK